MKAPKSTTVFKTAQDRPATSLCLAALVGLGLGVSSSQAQPANDMFANRIALTGTNILATGSNAGATKEPGEPNHAGDPGCASVWWAWTAPSSGTCTNRVQVLRAPDASAPAQFFRFLRK